MKFRLDLDPPTATAQQKKIRIVRGHPMMYESSRYKTAKSMILNALSDYVPREPLDGALELTVRWRFKRTKAHRKSEKWRTTRPDTDNLNKGLKDCMTACGFWHDDSQVVREVIEKKWVDEDPGIEITVKKLKN